jgi:hypothetical protein
MTTASLGRRRCYLAGVVRQSFGQAERQPSAQPLRLDDHPAVLKIDLLTQPQNS